jgi:16S rRNA (uracil1498-N3)-methyltransferase
VTVRRIRPGETVRLTDGAGRFADGPVVDVGARTFTVEVTDQGSMEIPQPRIVLVQALAKGEHAELAVSLSTQVGVDEVIPWAAERSVVKWDPDRADRALRKWRNTAREAAKQARRVFWPTVADLASTDDVCALLDSASLPVVLHEDAGTPMSSLVLPSAGDVLVVVGPEGGISDDERAKFEAHGATTARLGPTVLRSSSAGGVAAALLLSRTARWST